MNEWTHRRARNASRILPTNAIRYRERGRKWVRSFVLLTLTISLWAQGRPVSQPPQFEDYPVNESWHGTAPPLNLTSRWDRMFRTRLTNAAKEPPNFAGHFHFVTWGCGSECVSGAVIDLQNANIFAPPLATATAHFSVCQSAYENSGIEHRADSRLMIVRCGLNYSELLQRNVPDVYYFLWEGARFRELLHI